MSKNISKKIVALLLMAVMVMAMSMTAFADDGSSSTEYNVSILKDGESEKSMADDILVNHKATVTTLEDGKVQIKMSIKPITNYVPMSLEVLDEADGYLRSVTVVGAENEIENATSRYTTTLWTITLPKNSSISSGTKLDANKAYIELYYAGTEKAYWWSHITKNFDIQFN